MARNGQFFVRLHADDNVVVASQSIKAGTSLTVSDGGASTEIQVATDIIVASDIPIGHKIAIDSIESDAPVIKYGEVIGNASMPIQPGDWVHSHNLSLGSLSDNYEKSTTVPPAPTPITDRTFQGYRRADGRAGTRNYLCIISTVNCSANVSKHVARHFTPERLAEFPNVDGVIAVTHGTGCALKLRGSVQLMLNRVLGGFAKHPNVGGYLIIGLGCEQNAAGVLIQDEELFQIENATTSSEQPATKHGPLVLTMQDLGGTQQSIQAGIEAVESMLPDLNKVQREPIPASEIVLGTNCGGSDGNSGVTANPAVGYASDLLVACNATSVLAETSEIYGAEHLLTRRATTPDVADKLIKLIEWWHWYAGLFGEKLDNNPSIGNKAGGLTTIAEKSLGAIAKGGTTSLTEVYQYAEQILAKGLVIMDTPGFDPASVTGLVAGGANMIVFTTGRGSCFGCKPVPSIKIASNSEMYHRMESDMDINAGVVLEGKTIEQVGQHIFDEILAVASGKKTKSEELGIGEDEFVPWTVGPVL